MPHTWEWKVRLHLYEDDDGTTKAHLILDTGTTELTGHGTAHCHPADGRCGREGHAVPVAQAADDVPAPNEQRPCRG